MTTDKYKTQFGRRTMTKKTESQDAMTLPPGHSDQEIAPSESRPSAPREPTEGRRRRRGAPGTSAVSEADITETRLDSEEAVGLRGRLGRHLQLPRRWARRFLSSWGPSPTYRVLFFLVAIAIVMAFLIYSEYVINELRDSQRDRAELYAHLTTLVQSTTLPPQLEEWVIRHVVIHKEEIFPIVMTDHRGAIGDWGGPGLPDPGDRSAAALKAVRDIIGRMDAEREPIRFSGEQALGLVWLADGDMVISSHEKDIVIWEGPSLPPRADTTAAAVDMVFQRLQTMGRPDSIQVPAKAGSDFYWEGSNFVIADDAGRPLDWGGPVFSESSGFAEALFEMQRMATVSEPRNFRIETEKILHYGD